MEYPKPEPRQKIPAKKKQQSDRMKLLNAEYSRVLDEIDQEREPCCENCGANSFDHSHLIPRNYNDYAYMNEKSNIRRNCRRCHHAWEAGKMHLFPKIGKFYMEIVDTLDHQYWRQKRMQAAKALHKFKKENWLPISQGMVKIPVWLEELVADIEF